MALSSLNSPAIVTASQFSINLPIPKLTSTSTATATATLYSFSKPTNFLNLSGNDNSSIDKWRAKVSFFPAFLKKGKDAKVLKEELLEAIAPLDRGAQATPEDQQAVDEVRLFSHFFLKIPWNPFEISSSFIVTIEPNSVRIWSEPLALIWV